jgi:hypothetical protein
MERRRNGWLRGVAGWVACFFVAGCLLHQPSEATLANTGPEETKDPKSDATAVVPAKAPPEPQPLSNYHVLPVARSSSIEPPLESVFLDIGPKLDPTDVRPSDEPIRTISAETAPVPPAKEDPPLLAALRCALEKHPEEALALLQQYDPKDRDLLAALLSLTAGLGDGELSKLPPRQVERALEQLYGLTQNLRQRAPLSLGTVCFCHRIENFGQFVPMPGHYEFQAGESGRPGERVQVYAEVRNFRSVLHDGQYETHLLSSLAVHDERGQEVVLIKNLPCIDRSQTPRQDYFLNFQFHVFPKLPSGFYTLWVTVKDVTPTRPGQPSGPRISRRSLDFRVCPPGTRAAAQQ